jgi:hypothetical protein
MQTLQITTSHEQQATLDAGAVEQFQQSMQGRVISPEDEVYDHARRLWNGLIDKRPALIARCTGAADVAAAVHFARDHDLLLSVRGGGHNVAGRAVCDGGLVVDLSRMRAVRVDPARRTVQVQGGATLGEVDHETQAFDLAVPMGLVTATGIAGLTLHGGTGWLTRKYGLTLDNLVSVDIVTADGRIRKANETMNADLFWAVRGGGGNYGVVTSFEFQTHPVAPQVWFLDSVYPLSRAQEVLEVVRDFVRDAPEELGVFVTLWSAPDEQFIPKKHRLSPVIIVLGCWFGPFERGESVIRPLREIAEPVTDLSGPKRYLDVQRFFDKDYPDGRLYYWKSVCLQELNDAVIDPLIDQVATRPSPLSSLDIWFLRGAMNRVPADRTAFARRDVNYVLGIESNWTDPEQSNTNIAWAREVFEDMQQFARGSYLNFPGFVEDADTLLRGAYGANYERLQAIKAEYDPGNLFRGTLNIPPRG